MKIEKLKKDLATKTAELNTKKAEIRSFTESEDKTIDEVKAGMTEIKEKEDEIKEIRSNIEVLEQASALKVEEKRDDSDLVAPELEENSADNEEDDPEKLKTETKSEAEKDKKTVKDEEKRDAGGLQDMKLKVGGEIADKKVTAFADYLKTGEVRDVTGIALKDGKVIIPETILTPEKEVHQFPRLGSLVRTESVTTTTGKLPIFNNSTDLLTAHTEYGQTTKNATPVITPILWDLKTYTGGVEFYSATDTSYALGVASPITSSVQEPITVTWTPDATNTASTGYTSGTLTFNLIAQTTSNGALIGASAVNGGTGGYTLTTHTNLQNSLTVGFVGGTGGNYGNLSVSLNGATITGSKGTEPVPINYLNKVTGQPIPSMAQSSITANVNDTIGAALTAPSSTSPDNNTYTYVVPAAPTGYQANSATTTTVLAANPASTTNTSATTVSNFIVGTTNPNALNVSYTPSQQTVLFNWAKASGTTLANLPNQIAYGATGITDASVVTDNPFSNTTLLSSYATALSNAVPTGYNITQISNGTTTVSGATTAATLAAFTSQNPTVGATSTLNTYTVTLTAVSQTATYTYGYTSTALNTPAIPAILTSTGTTGGSVTTPTGYNTSPQIPSGYYISAIYAGTSASGTLISSSTTNGTNAAWPSGQVYAPTGNQYYIQLAPNTVNVTWFISIDPNPDNDPLNVAQGGFTPTVGSILGGSTTTNYQSQVIDNMNSLTGNTLSTTDNVTYTDGATGIKYIVTGYQYQEGTTTTATNSAPITT